MKAKRKISEEIEDIKDVRLWEARKLGASAKHAVQISEEEETAIDDSLGLQAITMRLQKKLVRQLKQLAKKEGLGYQPYVRQILTRHVRDVGLPVKTHRSA